MKKTYVGSYMLLLAGAWMGVRGELGADLRTRSEHARQDGKNDATALTTRLRLGYETDAWQGLSAGAEFEATRALDPDAYNAAGVSGSPDRAVIADPESTELNQAFLSYKPESRIGIRAGRQQWLLGNARFLGDVGWRQNNQTYDAAVLTLRPLEKAEAVYGYVEGVQRIFGSEAEGAKRRLDSDSHVLYLTARPAAGIEVGTYGLWLDFDNADNLSSDTLGTFVTATHAYTDRVSAEGRLEAARQSASGDDEAEMNYSHLQAGLRHKEGWRFLAGWERLGSDSTEGERVAFQTPLATLHAFNGWADMFLTTPPDGLRDLYLISAAPLPGKVTLSLELHQFEADYGNADYGRELDLLLRWPLSPACTALLKFADYRAEDFGVDTQRVTAEVNLRF
jgi:hypothetical protein